MTPWLSDTPLPEAPALAGDAVHVWCASLDDPPIAAECLLEVLSTEERAASRYAAEQDQFRAMAARGLLRWLLGSYLGVPAGAVRLRQGAHGKPELSGDQSLSRLCFNVSH